MNYRHAFHAGNFADVLKHVVLVGLLEALKHKPAPFCCLDTHAGAGAYDLRGNEAGKTREYADGVARLAGVAAPAGSALQTYIELLSSINDGAAMDALHSYPGSPLIAARLMRACDRAILCDVQHDEVAALRALFARDARVGVHERDGYAALAALLPPRERRGLVLIDPPFEAQDGEFRAIETALAAAWKRWPTGIYAIWYPIKQRESIRPFHRWLSAHAPGRTLAAELMRERDDSPLRLNGCGMAIVNPPWHFEAELARVLPILQRQMAAGRDGAHRVSWLAADAR